MSKFTGKGEMMKAAFSQCMKASYALMSQKYGDVACVRKYDMEKFSEFMLSDDGSTDFVESLHVFLTAPAGMLAIEKRAAKKAEQAELDKKYSELF